MDWLVIGFLIFAAWVAVTVIANERRRLVEAAAPLPSAVPAVAQTARHAAH